MRFSISYPYKLTIKAPFKNSEQVFLKGGYRSNVLGCEKVATQHAEKQ
jgi:hypothetical protein